MVRWLVLLSLLYAIYRAYAGWIRAAPFSGRDNFARHVAATIAHVQLVLGLWLYIISPVTRYFRSHYSEAVHDRQIRFFGMEHSVMMLVGIIIITIGSSAAKRRPTDERKFKTMALWYTAALLIILSSIPWTFSPLVSRPYFRWF